MDERAQIAESVGEPLTHRPESMRDILNKTAKAHAGNVAIASLYQTPSAQPLDTLGTSKEYVEWTYGELNDKAEKLVSSLFAKGVRRGARVAVFIFNSAELALLFWASVKLGATLVPLDPRTTPRKELVHHYLEVIQPTVLVVADETVAQALEQSNSSDLKRITLKIILQSQARVDSAWYQLTVLADKYQVNGDAAALDLQVVSGVEDVVLIVFTSGTYGLPKACPHTNKNLWVAAQAADSFRLLDSSHRLAQHMPPSHITGFCDMIHFWITGATVVFPSPAFDAKATIEAIERLRCTHMFAIPTILLALLGHPSFSHEKVQTLQSILLGGTMITPEALQAATHKSKLGADQAIAAYGMSEGIPICANSTKQGINQEKGVVCLGKILPGAKARVCEAGSRKALTRGEVGELHLGGDMIINEYLYGDNTSFYTDDGGHWLATGDQAKMNEDGTLYLLGRYKDIIIRGAENLSPGLIESCLNKAGVIAQVVGVPDEVAGEVPLAVIQPLAPGPLPCEKMQEIVLQTLGPACVPAMYVTLQEIGLKVFPMTTSGKVRKEELKGILLKHLSTRSNPNGTVNLSESVLRGEMTVTEQLLTRTVSKLIGQSSVTIPLDAAIVDMIDSINTLRLQSSIRNSTSKNISTEALLSAASIRALAKQIDNTPSSDTQAPKSSVRQGTPGVLDMVHTQGNPASAQRTKSMLEPLLAKLDMTWDEVEDVCPVPDLSSRIFSILRPLGFSMRMTYIAQSADSSRLRKALEDTLSQWPILRSIAAEFDNVPLLVLLRAGNAWSRVTITEVPTVETPQELTAVKLQNAEALNVHARDCGPLARFVISNIKSTGNACLVALIHHATYDSISLQAFSEDLESNLKGIGSPVESLTTYKLFADTYYQYRSSVPAQIAIAFHVDRLRGISSLRENCWPPQRSPGWFIGDDRGHTIPSGTGAPLLQDRVQIDNDNGFAGLIGIKKLVKLPSLTELRSKYRISPPMVFKAACAIVNAHLTGSSEVIFSNTQAGRRWPHLDDGVAKFLPNPVTIAGNTLGIVINRIQVHPNETTGTLLRHLEDEQKLLTRYEHAPITAIAAQLNPGDAAALQASRKQLFNWNPNSADFEVVDMKRELQPILIEGFTEVMLEWHCGMADGETGRVVVRWDGCQAGRETVEGWTERFVKALEWVAKVENLEREIGKLEL